MAKKIFHACDIDEAPPLYKVADFKIRSYAAHGGAITSLTWAGEQRDYIVSAGLDSYIKIWDIGGTQLASWSINVLRML